MLAFYQAFLTGTPRPKFTWNFEANGDIRVDSKDKPTAVKLWQATNPEHRDFRLATLGPQHQSTDLEDRAPGAYLAHAPKPHKGWTPHLAETTYPSPAKDPSKSPTAAP